MMEPQKPLVRLFDTEEIGIIITFPSGVSYSNQVGGYSCLHKIHEGIYVPLHTATVKIEETFYKYFTGKKWKGSCASGIDNEDADFIDENLKDCYTTKFLKVNRDKLKESCEAWIYVTGSDPKEEIPIITGFNDFEAVLTWQNSD